MPLVSVILPTCDRPALWPRALDSVLRQTCADLEVLLVDSNRAAPPVRAQPEFAARRADARVVLVEGAHRPNASAARNLGLAAARGEWIT
ncbi:MAG TPA: glycosyltransferase family A protein, partial [Opitutus sp.]|nr:glycosyltransferase family A protein [Opitutus sp.]